MDIENLFPPPQRLSPDRQERIRSILLGETSPAVAPSLSPRPSRRWRFMAAAAAAVAAVTAVAVTLAVTIPSGHPGGPPAQHLAAGQPTGRQILLAAAASVAHQNPGRYWHFWISETANIPGSVNSAVDQWTEHDGNWWTSPPCRQGLTGKVVMHKAGGMSFGIGKHPTTQAIPTWTYDLVRRWPTTVAALKAQIGGYAINKTYVLEALVALELLVPSPPALRAAAYQAIATFPGVRNLGTVKGGQALFVPARDGGPLHLVIDPATGLIHRETWPEATGTGTQTVLAAQWTNQLPRVIPPNKYYCSAHHH